MILDIITAYYRFFAMLFMQLRGFPLTGYQYGIKHGVGYIMNDHYSEIAIPSRGEKMSESSNGIEVRPTICSICNPGSHCGIDAHVKNGRIIKIKGSLEAHNAGTLCAKGAAGLQYVYHPSSKQSDLPSSISHSTEAPLTACEKNPVNPVNPVKKRN